MARVKRGVTKHARHKKVLSAAKGSRGRQKNTFREQCRELKKIDNMPTEIENKKREFRKLWIVRINAACRELGMKYSEFISKLKKKPTIR